MKYSRHTAALTPYTPLCYVIGYYCLGRKKQRAGQNQSSSGAASGRPAPDFNDPQAVQAFFLQEIQTGEAKLALGNLLTIVI